MNSKRFAGKAWDDCYGFRAARFVAFLSVMDSRSCDKKAATWSCRRSDPVVERSPFRFLIMTN